jgi:hypothetical protein
MLNFYGLVLARKAQKRNTIKFGRPVCNQKMLKLGPKFLINAELYGLVLAARLKKGIPSNLGGQFATKKCSNLAPSFFGPNS